MNYQNSKKDMFVCKSGMSFHLLKAIDIYTFDRLKATNVELNKEMKKRKERVEEWSDA
jgi:hypothetical protein